MAIPSGIWIYFFHDISLYPFFEKILLLPGFIRKLADGVYTEVRKVQEFSVRTTRPIPIDVKPTGC